MKLENDKQPKNTLIGAQRPRIELAPLYVTSLGKDAVDLAKICNIYLDDWQAYTLEKALGVNSEGGWACTDVGLIVPRQNGKNVVIEARELAGCFLLGETNIGHTAHEYRTAFNAQQTLIMKLKTSPELMEYVYGFDGDIDANHIKGFKTGHGFESIIFDFKNERGNGLNRFSTISYSTRTKDGGRGLTGDVLIFDEAYALTEEQMGAIIPQISARSMTGRVQTWWTSSAGMVASEPLRRLRNEGISGGRGDLGFFEWSVPEDADMDDVKNWALSNPAFNIRISEKQIASERKAMNDEQFGRERLGIWNDQQKELNVIDDTDWQACVTLQETKITNKVFFSLDIPPKRDFTTLAVSTHDDEGNVLVEIVAREYGTAWVVDKLLELQNRHAGSYTVVDSGSAVGSILNDLRRSRVRVKEITSRDYGKACGLFYDLVLTRKLQHTNQEVLNLAVSNAKMRPLGDSLWKWARIDSAVDISPLIAVTQSFHATRQEMLKKANKNKTKNKQLIF